MAEILSISINLSKLDKARIIKGKKGQYYNFDVFVNDEKDTYGNDVAVATTQTKEEREKKDPKTYLGGGRKVWSGTRGTSKTGNSAGHQGAGDDLPF